MPRKRTAILISGRGSNMMSLVEAAGVADFPADIVGVIANRPDAAGIAWASKRGLSTRIIDHKAFPDRAAFEAVLNGTLTELGAEFVCLAGFMRVLTAGFVGQWQGRLINIHPSLLPSFKGLHTHEQALEAGVRVAGCTVHFVVPEMDAGPIIVQGAVPVLTGDTAGSLAARVLGVEHRIYPLALRLLASGGVRMEAGRAIFSAQIQSINQSQMLISPAADKLG